MINTYKYLAYTLRFKRSEIESIIRNIDNFYTEKVIIKEGKKKPRIINPSHNRLKVIQKRIQKIILLEIELPDYAYGAVKGRDNVDNANIHKGSRID